MAIEISDWNDLAAIDSDLTEDYVLVNDIDSSSDGYNTHASSSANSGAGWAPLGNVTTQFTGSFDGQGFTISDLFSDRTSAVGLFGYVTSTTYIRNVGVLDVDINSEVTAGALIALIPHGIATGLVVSNCYSTGSITTSRPSGAHYGGGLIGAISNRNGSVAVLVENCYSRASVEATTSESDYRIGGFIGWVRDGDNTIDKCYATGLVTAANSGATGIGGFCGNLSFSVGTISNCFWDTTTSGQASDGTSSTATGKTTAEMKDRDTFTDTATSGLSVAWDMAAIDTYDDTKIWGIGELDSVTINAGYPYLMSFQGNPLIDQALTATAQASALIVKQIQRDLEVTASATASFTRSIGRTLEAIVQATASFVRELGRTLQVTAQATPSLQAGLLYAKELLVTAQATASMLRAEVSLVALTVTAQATATVGRLQSFLRDITATAQATTSLTTLKTLSKIITATASATASVVQSGLTISRELVVTASATVTFTVRKTLSYVLSTTAGAVVSLLKDFGYIDKYPENDATYEDKYPID